MKPEDCTYSFLNLKHTRVATDNLLLGERGVESWVDAEASRLRPDEYGGERFDINQFSFVQERRTGRRNIVCNTVQWCPSCRRFHGCDPKPDDWNRLWPYRDDFIKNCRPLFDQFYDNRGWRINECERCAKTSPVGYVYVAKTNGAVKIGITKADPKKRMGDLQTACPWPIELHRFYRCNNIRNVESSAHYVLRKHRMCGEWFSVEPDKAAAVVEAAIQRIA